MTSAGMLPADALKPGLTYDDAAEIFWPVASPAVYELLVEGRGWTPERFERWIAHALADLLLDPRRAAPNRRRRPPRFARIPSACWQRLGTTSSSASPPA